MSPRARSVAVRIWAAILWQVARVLFFAPGGGMRRPTWIAALGYRAWSACRASRARVRQLQDAHRFAALVAEARGAPLYRCAGPSCPGLPWKASDRRHPETCAQPGPLPGATPVPDSEERKLPDLAPEFEWIMRFAAARFVTSGALARKDLAPLWCVLRAMAYSPLAGLWTPEVIAARTELEVDLASWAPHANGRVSGVEAWSWKRADGLLVIASVEPHDSGAWRFHIWSGLEGQQALPNDALPEEASR